MLVTEIQFCQIDMGGGASSTASTARNNDGGASKSTSSSISPASVPSAKDRLRVKDLETQVLVLEDRASKDAACIRHLEARVRAAEAQSQAVPHGTIQGFDATLEGLGFRWWLGWVRGLGLSANYAKPIALSAARRDESHMKSVFERHKDIQGGLSKTALMAALR